MSDVSEDQVTYTFEASDKAVITLRRLTDRERTRLFGWAYKEIIKRFQLFANRSDVNINEASEEVVSTEEIQPLYDAFRNPLLAVVRPLVSAKDYKVLESWSDPGDWIDLYALLMRINVEEIPKAEETVVPKPEDVDNLTDDEVARLGGSSPPKSTRGGTRRSSPAAATSSSGTASTPVTTPEIAATSPPAS
jgi:hypothetical protein